VQSAGPVDHAGGVPALNDARALPRRAISPNGNLIATPDRFGLLLVDLSSPTRRARASMQSLAKAMAFASEEQLLTVSQMVGSRSVWLDQDSEYYPLGSLETKVVSWSVMAEKGEYVVHAQKETVLDVRALASPKSGAPLTALTCREPRRERGFRRDWLILPSPQTRRASPPSRLPPLGGGPDHNRNRRRRLEQPVRPIVQTLQVRLRLAPFMFMTSGKLAYARDWIVLGDGSGALQVWRRRSADGVFEEYAQFPGPWTARITGTAAPSRVSRSPIQRTTCLSPATRGDAWRRSICRPKRRR